MSPKPKKAAPRSLTVEFSGICTLLWNKKTSSATVQMVDLASAGFDRHHVALGLVADVSTARGVKGPDADSAVSLPGSERDVGLWNLMGCDVEIVGASGKLTVDDSEANVSKKPGKQVTSIQWLANVGFLANSNSASPVCSTAATMTLGSGALTAKNVGEPRKIEFIGPEGPVGPARYCVSRFQVVIPFETELAMRLDRRRVLRFSETHSIVISNTCVCGMGLEHPPDHFLAHYEVVRAKRRPSIKPAPAAGAAPKFAAFPDWCLGGFVEV